MFDTGNTARPVVATDADKPVDFVAKSRPCGQNL